MVIGQIISLTQIILKKIEGFKMSEITKEMFDVAYNKHLPNRWIKFAYEHFSKQNINGNIKFGNIVTFSFVGLFLVGFINTVLGKSNKLIAFTSIIYLVSLTILVMYVLSAIIMNNIRLRKIANELGITRKEFIILSEKYYN